MQRGEKEEMSTPVIGRNAVIQMGVTTIGYATGVTASVNVDKIEDFTLQSDKATILAAGNKHYKVSCDKLWIDSTYVNAVLAGTAVDFIIGPAGTTTGKIKWTIKNVILLVWDFKADQKGVVSEKVSGEGNDFQVSTF
jgi:hypothetical protein